MARLGRCLLRFSAAVALLAAAGPLAAQSYPAWQSLVAEASARFGIPEAWIWRVIDAESAGQTTRGGRPIRSSAGAMGLMQLMPETWAAMRQAHGLGADPDNPRDNILAGTAYLRAMYDRFGYPGMFAAYNAGPGRYADHLARGRRLPGETVAYVAKVTGRSGEALPPARRVALPSRMPGLVVIHGDRDGDGNEARQGGVRGRADDRPAVFFTLSGDLRP